VKIGYEIQRIKFKNARIDIRLKNRRGKYILLYFDKEVLQMVLDNLISNALKYTEKGINYHWSSLFRTWRHKLYRYIWVTETDRYRTRSAATYLFERYYQEGGKHQASGTGIGLSLVKSLVTLP
jgi:signal transduction histidine kinase